VPAAIELMRAHDWDRVCAEYHELTRELRQRVTELTRLPPPCPDSPEWYTQMVAVPLPGCDIDTLKNRLYDEYRIELPLVAWNGKTLVRASFQAHNTREDVDCIVSALLHLVTHQSEYRPM